MTPVIDSDDDGAVLRAVGMVRGVIAHDDEHVRAVMTAAIGNDDYKARMRTVGVRGDPDSGPLGST